MILTELSTQVEWGKGFKAKSGTLSLAHGHLRFDTVDATAFNVSVGSIQIVWHWYSFSTAFETTIEGTNYFLSFMPRGAGLNSWHGGLTTGRQWRAALAGRPVPTSGPIVAKIFVGVFWLLRLFFLVVAALLSLATAIKEGASNQAQIVGGVGAALITTYIIFFIVVGFQSLLAMRKGPSA